MERSGDATDALSTVLSNPDLAGEIFQWLEAKQVLRYAHADDFLLLFSAASLWPLDLSETQIISHFSLATDFSVSTIFGMPMREIISSMSDSQQQHRSTKPKNTKKSRTFLRVCAS
jgi:hypothetical protein